MRVKVGPVEAPRYRGRKDWPTMNVLAACTPDLKFTYVLAGWEGSASDSRVLRSALNRDGKLIIPNGIFLFHSLELIVQLIPFLTCKDQMCQGNST